MWSKVSFLFSLANVTLLPDKRVSCWARLSYAQLSIQSSKNAAFRLSFHYETAIFLPNIFLKHSLQS